MFVKIRYFKKLNSKQINLDREIVYDCKRASIGGIRPEPPNIDITDILLILDVGEQNERSVEFSCNSDTECVEVYYMNNEGKTIEKYIY